jgi:DNA helicase MCM8
LHFQISVLNFIFPYRPIGFSNLVKLSTANQTIGKLITVIGTVVREEPITISNKMVCFRCSQCSTELVVRQDPQVNKFVYPSSCHRGCPARGRFVELLTSPFTIYQSKQKITLKESLYDDKQEFKMLEVELVQDFVDSAVLGTVVSVSGVVKHGVQKKFLKKTEGKFFKSYLKCFNLETLEGTDKCVEDSDAIHDGPGLIEAVKSQDSPFRLLVHSLCPSIFGREEVKAGLVLALLSGSNLLKKRRSVSHVLLIGSPGVGKSALLEACAAVSTKGILQSGPTSTAVGLTASVAKNGVMEAGAL